MNKHKQPVFSCKKNENTRNLQPFSASNGCSRFHETPNKKGISSENQITPTTGRPQAQNPARLDKTKFPKKSGPVLAGGNLRYEISDRVHGLGYGGISLFHKLARDIGLIDAIDKRLTIFKVRLPYTESDHVFNLAANTLCNGDCLQDIELRRNDVNYLDALGAQRIPDPTTAGDFCRRLTPAHINTLQDIYDDVRIGVWRHQPASFFNLAILDADGTLVPTTGQCKAGMDIAYNGIWGYHPLVISLANTREVLPSSIAAAIGHRTRALPRHSTKPSPPVCGAAHKVLLRGDTDFSQTEHLDRWNADGRISFIFGYDARDNLKALAEQLPAKAWKKLTRPARYQALTGLRHRPVNVKDKRGRTWFRNRSTPQRRSG